MESIPGRLCPFVRTRDYRDRGEQKAWVECTSRENPGVRMPPPARAGTVSRYSETAELYSRVERAPERQNINIGRGSSASSLAISAISSGDW